MWALDRGGYTSGPYGIYLFEISLGKILDFNKTMESYLEKIIVLSFEKLHWWTLGRAKNAFSFQTEIIKLATTFS